MTTLPAMQTGQPAGMLVNGALIRERRLELGLSERRVAALMGPSFSQTVVRGVETGTNHSDLTIGELVRLADLLSLPVADLLTTTAGDDAPQQVGAETLAEFLDRVVPQVSVVLFELGRLVPVESLAETLGLPLADVEAALHELDARLAGVGLCVHRLGNDAKIARRHDAPARGVLKKAWREQAGRTGLNLSQVRLLYRAARGEVPKTLRNPEQVAAGQLVNAGILIRTQSGGVTLADDAAFSLQLANSSMHPAARRR